MSLIGSICIVIRKRVNLDRMNRIDRIHIYF